MITTLAFKAGRSGFKPSSQGLKTIEREGATIEREGAAFDICEWREVGVFSVLHFVLGQ